MMTAAGAAVRVLLTGWFSFRQGEVTAGDVLALESVSSALDAAGLGYDTAWSEVFRPGGLRLDEALPQRYSHLIFVCGPVHGQQVAGLHGRFPGSRRIAIGVTVGQGEYGERRRHDVVIDWITGWLGSKICAPVPLETRLDIRDWRLCSTAEAFMSLVARLDIVVTTRLHGLALALSAGVPVLAVDPVAGGGKVTAQARAWGWPGLVPAEHSADPGRLDDPWDWCLSAAGRQAAHDASRQPDHDARSLLATLMACL